MTEDDLKTKDNLKTKTLSINADNFKDKDNLKDERGLTKHVHLHQIWAMINRLQCKSLIFPLCQQNQYQPSSPPATPQHLQNQK